MSLLGHRRSCQYHRIYCIVNTTSCFLTRHKGQVNELIRAVVIRHPKQQAWYHVNIFFENPVEKIVSRTVYRPSVHGMPLEDSPVSYTVSCNSPVYESVRAFFKQRGKWKSQLTKQSMVRWLARCPHYLHPYWKWPCFRLYNLRYLARRYIYTMHLTYKIPAYMMIVGILQRV
jgi:hypothetical protein